MSNPFNSPPTTAERLKDIADAILSLTAAVDRHSAAVLEASIPYGDRQLRKSLERLRSSSSEEGPRHDA